MRIQLNQHEIHEALAQYVQSQGVDTLNKSIDITMTAGRGENGYTADINIVQSAKLTTPTLVHRTINEGTVSSVEENLPTEESTQETEIGTSLFGAE